MAMADGTFNRIRGVTQQAAYTQAVNNAGGKGGTGRQSAERTGACGADDEDCLPRNARAAAGPLSGNGGTAAAAQAARGGHAQSHADGSRGCASNPRKDARQADR